MIFVSPGYSLSKGCAMVKELPVPGTEIIQSRLPFRGTDKSVLGAFPVTHFQYFTFEAVPRQGN
jgi:hypothetical protein